VAYVLKNFSYGELASGITDLSTQMALASGYSLPEAGVFVVVVWNMDTYPNPADDPNTEIMLAEYSGLGVVFNITRAQEDTIAAAHAAGSQVALHMTAGLLSSDRFVIGSLSVDEASKADTKTLLVSGSKLVYGGHDNLFGFVSDEHVAHGSVSILAGTGMSGGGTIAVNRTLTNADRGSVAVAAHEITYDHDAYDALTSLDKTDGNFIVGDGATWVAESGNTARTSLGVGTGDAPELADVVLGGWQLGTPTYDSVHDWMNNTQSAGRITGGDFTDNEDGTLTVAAGTGLIKTTDSRTGVTLMFDWAEDVDVKTEGDVALTDGATNYIYVDYNNGIPVVYSTTNQSDINFTTKIGLGRVFRDGTKLHMLPGGVPTNDISYRTHQALSSCVGFRRCRGLATSETGDLGIAITEGTVWKGLRDFDLFAGTGYNSTVTDFILWHNDGAWQSSATGVLTHNYNNYGVGLVAVKAQQYGVFWVYLHHDDHVHVVYGVDTYKYAEALAAVSPQNLPAIISDFSILIARIIIKKEETTTFTTVTAPWDFAISGIVTNHDSLANLTFGDSGHTGFQAAGDVLDDLNTLGAVASDGQMIVGTEAGVFAYESGATLRTSIGVDASGTAAGLVSTHESTYNHGHYNTAYDHSQLVAGNPHNVTPTELSLLIGTDTQAWDAQLDDIAALGVTDGNFIVGNGSNWVAESGNTARTSLGLGTGDSPTLAGLTVTDYLHFSPGGVGNLTIGEGAGINLSGGSTYNICCGLNAGRYSSGGDENVFIGAYAGDGDAVTPNSGSWNMCLGTSVGRELTTGSANVGIGVATLRYIEDGGQNTTIGYSAFRNLKSGNFNTGIGYNAGYLCTGNNNVFLGYHAGRFQVAVNDMLLINNRSRVNAANELTQSLLYGTFANAVADQQLTINGELRGSYGAKIGDGGTTDYLGISATGEVTFHGASKISVDHQTLLNFSFNDMHGDEDAQLVAGDIASTTYTHKGRKVWSFDDTVEQALLTDPKVMPAGIDGFSGTLHATLFLYMGSDNTNDIAMDVFVEAVTPDADTLDLETATGWDSVNAGTISLAGTTAGDLVTMDITLTNADNAAVGDLVRFGIRRDCDSVNDDASGDVNLVALEIWR